MHICSTIPVVPLCEMHISTIIDSVNGVCSVEVVRHSQLRAGGCGSDFKFPLFNANLTLDYGPFDKRANVGMIGETLGEGHYGLVIVGDTNVSHARVCLHSHNTLLLSHQLIPISGTAIIFSHVVSPFTAHCRKHM